MSSGPQSAHQHPTLAAVQADASRPGAHAVALQAVAAHREWTGRQPSLLGIAPGRVNLIGEHTDYAGGAVLPVAIDRWTVASISPGAASLGPWRVRSLEPGATPAEFAGAEPLVAAALRPRLPAWAMYVAGVVEHVNRAAIHRGCSRLGAMDVTIASSVPLGAGLASSASLELAVASALAAAARVDFTPADLARIGRRAEREFAGAPCGVMDQLACGAARAGHALLINCRDESVQHVALPAGLAMLVADSGVKHAVPDGLYAAKVAACERAARALCIRDLSEPIELTGESLLKLDPAARAATLHVRSENARVHACVQAFASGDLRLAGTLLTQSHTSLSEVLAVSCPELDALVHRAGTIPGVLGARMTGAGFGGCVVVLARAAEAESVETLLRASKAASAKIASRMQTVAGCVVCGIPLP